MTKWLKWIGVIAVAGIAALQFTNPPRTNPAITAADDVMATNPPPAEIAALLRNACYDCHSSETHWPWYSYIAPMSWTVVRDVNDARDTINFSDWPNDDPHRARKRWRRIAEAVEANEMPLSKYTVIHRASRLTAEQRKKLVDWARQASETLGD